MVDYLLAIVIVLKNVHLHNTLNQLVKEEEPTVRTPYCGIFSQIDEAQSDESRAELNSKAVEFVLGSSHDCIPT